MGVNRRLVLLSFALAFGGGLWFCSTPDVSPEAQIKHVISQIETGVQNAQLPMIMEHISDGYSDDLGWTRDSLSRFLLIQFKKRGPISAVFTPIETTVNEKRARSKFGVMLTEAERESIMGWPVNAEVLDFEVRFHCNSCVLECFDHRKQRIVRFVARQGGSDHDDTHTID